MRRPGRIEHIGTDQYPKLKAAVFSVLFRPGRVACATVRHSLTTAAST